MKSNISAETRSPLVQPGNLSFPTNYALLSDPSLEGCTVQHESSGHLVYFGPFGRRILATDPDGNPLHECEWERDASGAVRLCRARIQLDWGQWIGVKPEGIVHSTQLDLTTQTGWKDFKVDALRRMAAEAIGVDTEEVKFFYNDEDLVIREEGLALIRHRKDALYVLDHGGFEHARFMACMGAMHWERIDFLPVVELFQSLLPGTGSATLELIRGLYDDQHEAMSSPLRYRGVPTYPSEAAFRLFSGFFSPSVSGGQDPFTVFMVPAQSHKVTWLPSSDWPRRYFDRSRSLCLTLKSGIVQKVTMGDDPAGLSYFPPDSSGFAPSGRTVQVSKGLLLLRKGQECVDIEPLESWPSLSDSPSTSLKKFPYSWEALLHGKIFAGNPQEAFSAVLLYPENDSEIGEESSHPFAADYIQDLLGEHEQLAEHMSHAQSVLIVKMDGALGTCFHLDRPRDYVVEYHNPVLIQKHVQNLWNQLAKTNRLGWGGKFTFVHTDVAQPPHTGKTFDLVYYWVPFSCYKQPQGLAENAQRIQGSIHSRTVSFVVGPQEMGNNLQALGLKVLYELPGEQLPGFLVHKTLLPQATLHSGLTLFIVVR